MALVVALVVGGCVNDSSLVSTLDNRDGSSTGGDDTSVPDAGPLDSGGDSDDTGEPPASGPPVLVYCVEAAGTLCERLYSCSTQAASLRDSLESSYGFESADGCREKLTREIAGFCQPAALSAQKGRATYEPGAAEACLGQLETASCDTVFAGLPSLRTLDLFQPSFCDDIAVAKQQVSESCLAHSDCAADDAYCDGSVYSGNTARNGTCSMRGQAGVACTLPQDCSASLYCDNSGTCAQPPAQGEACTNVCQSGLVCNRELDTCQPPGAENDPCYQASDCRVDLACSGDTNTCVAAPALDEQCWERCQSGLRCNFGTYTCESLPGAGESCSTDCAQGLTCSSNFECVPVAAAGESCATNECAEGLFCKSSDTTCAAPATIGASCQPGDCIWYANCSGSGTCEALPTLGEACTDECVEPSLCSGGTCVDPSTLEPCDNGSCSASNERCEDGLCVQ
jgi:hypothetical protein